MKEHVLCCAIILFAALPAQAGPTQNAFELGVAAAEENHYDLAISEFNKAIAANPRDADAYFQRARSYNFQKKFQNVISDCDSALKINPTLGRAYEFRGFAYLLLGQMEKGSADLKKALLYEHVDEFDVLTPGLFNNLSKLANMSGNRTEALKFYNRAHVLEMIKEAKELRETKQMEKALDLLNKAISLSPNETSAYLVRGVLNSNMSEYSKALLDFSTAIRLDPKLVPAYYYRADVNVQLGRQKQAVADYNKLIELNPRFVAFRLVTETGRLRDHFYGTDDHIVNMEDVYYLRGKSESALGDRPEAIRDYDIASKMDSADNEPSSRKAELLSKSGLTNLALKSLSSSVKVDDTDWQTLASRARVYEVQKDYTRALKDYSRIISIFPKQPGAYFLRAQLSAKLGDFGGAIKDYTQMITLDPDLDDAYGGRADAFLQSGHYKQAVDDCTMGIKRDAANATLFSLRAKAYEKLGQKALAAQDRARALAKPAAPSL